MSNPWAERFYTFTLPIEVVPSKDTYISMITSANSECLVVSIYVTLCRQYVSKFGVPETTSDWPTVSSKLMPFCSCQVLIVRFQAWLHKLWKKSELPHWSLQEHFSSNLGANGTSNLLSMASEHQAPLVPALRASARTHHRPQKPKKKRCPEEFQISKRKRIEDLGRNSSSRYSRQSVSQFITSKHYSSWSGFAAWKLWFCPPLRGSQNLTVAVPTS